MTPVFFKIVDALLYVRHPRLMAAYFRKMGHWPRPSLPRNFNEKLLWRKLFDRDPRFPQLSDKLRSKAYVGELYPSVRTAKVLWEGTDPAKIPDHVLAGNCVAKANHGCGWHLLIRDGKVDRRELARKARKWMRRRYYGRRRMEWGYKDITPRLYVEEMIMDADKAVDREYKCYIAGGSCIFVYAKQHRPGEAPLHAVLGPDGVARVTRCSHRFDSELLDKPRNWDTITATAESMGREFDSVRCDLYEINGQIWFSEFTFYTEGGYDHIDWPEVYGRLGDKWDLRLSSFFSQPARGLMKLYRNRLGEALNKAKPAGRTRAKRNS